MCAPIVELLLGLAPHMQIEREEHVMIRTRGLWRLIVTLFAACAAMAVIPVAQADPTGAQSELTAVTGQGWARSSFPRPAPMLTTSLPRSKSTSTKLPRIPPSPLPGRRRAGRWRLHQYQFRDGRDADHVGWRCGRSGVRTDWPASEFRSVHPSDRRRWDCSGEPVHGHSREVTSV